MRLHDLLFLLASLHVTDGRRCADGCGDSVAGAGAGDTGDLRVVAQPTLSSVWWLHETRAVRQHEVLLLSGVRLPRRQIMTRLIEFAVGFALLPVAMVFVILVVLWAAMAMTSIMAWSLLSAVLEGLRYRKTGATWI